MKLVELIHRYNYCLSMQEKYTAEGDILRAKLMLVDEMFNVYKRRGDKLLTEIENYNVA